MSNDRGVGVLGYRRVGMILGDLQWDALQSEQHVTRA